MSMKLITLLCVCITHSLCLADGSVDIETAVARFFANDGSSRVSGKATYVHQVYEKAVNVDDYTNGIEFEDTQHMETYLKTLTTNFGLDFTLEEDSNRDFVEKYYFDNDKARKDRVEISDEMATVIKSNGVPNSLDFTIHAFDGSKTISVGKVLNKDGESMVADIVGRKISVPKFHQFGLNNSDKDTTVFLDAIKDGVYILSGHSKDGYIYANIKLKDTGISFELAMDPSKDMVALSNKMYMGEVLISESIYEDYIRTDSGYWHPRKYTLKKFAPASNGPMKIYEEKFELVGDSVDFNIPLEDDVFKPTIPYGTLVNDWRYEQPIEYILNPPGQSDLDVLENGILETNNNSLVIPNRKEPTMQNTLGSLSKANGSDVKSGLKNNNKSDNESHFLDRREKQRETAKRISSSTIFMLIITGGLLGFFLIRPYCNYKRSKKNTSPNKS